MTNITEDDVEAFIEDAQRAARAKEANKDQKNGEGAHISADDRYRAEREENDRRRSRRSGEGDRSDGSQGNSRDWQRGAHRVPRSRHRSRSPASAEPMTAPNSPLQMKTEPMDVDPRSPKIKTEGVSPRIKEEDVKAKVEGGSPRIKHEGSSRRDPRGTPPGVDRYVPSQDDGYRPSSRGYGGHGGRRGNDRRSRSPRGPDDRRGDGKYRDRDPERRRPNHVRYPSDRSPPRSGRGGYHNGRRAPPAPEPTDDERDRRTVFVQQLANRVRTRELTQFFEAAGEVVEAQIVKDRVSNRSKGVGYVEFREEESVEKAIALTGQKLCGIPIIAQLTEAEKNRQARTTEGTATQSNGVPFHRLYVGNIHFSINEEDLKNVFEPFGELEFVQLQKEEHTGRSKGYGFVQYHDATQAKEALDKMNGFELAGRAIRVGLGNDKFTHESTQHLLRSQPQFTGSSFSGAGGRGAPAGGSANFDRASGRDAEKAGGASALDDTDVGGVNFNNYSRDSLMRKLARTEDPEPKLKPKVSEQKAAAVPQAPPSRCVLLKNVYDQAEETEPDWKQDLKADIKEECEDKYGVVKHLDLALDNDDGEVYIKFDRVEGGKNAIQGLNGRWFNGRTLAAQYVVEAMYNANFPKAKNL